MADGSQIKSSMWVMPRYQDRHRRMWAEGVQGDLFGKARVLVRWWEDNGEPNTRFYDQDDLVPFKEPRGKSKRA